MTLILAIDGGGTSCKAAIAGPDGVVLGQVTTGPANIVTDPKAAAGNITEAASAILKAAGRADYPLQKLSAFLGLAGANVGPDHAGFTALLPFARVHVEDDAAIALEGALGAEDGLVAVLGTGSVYLGRHEGQITRAGGWGFMVGDLGSGARLGRALLQDTLLAYDRILPRSALTRLVLSEFGDDPVRLVAFAQGEKPAGFARFAPLVFEHAASGDVVAGALVKGAVAHVDAALAAVSWPDCPRLCLLGGLSHLYAPHLAPGLRAILTPAKGDALAGAVTLASRRFGASA